jgi:hypothetical protein
MCHMLSRMTQHSFLSNDTSYDVSYATSCTEMNVFYLSQVSQYILHLYRP